MELQGKSGTYIISKSQKPRGSFGGVQLGLRVHDQLPITIKQISAAKGQFKVEALSKITALNHAFLAPIIETIQTDENIFLVRPYIEGSSLKTVFKKQSIYKHLDARFFIELTINLLKGLEYLHSQGLVHCDIKPSNIIVKHHPQTHPSEWLPADVVLIDFDQASTYPYQEAKRAPFALVYSPPEQLLNYNWLINPNSDLFALTITLFELLSGSPPWVDCNAEILLNLQLTYPMKKPSSIDADLFEILSRAAYKEPFSIPPRRLAPEVIETILKKGIEDRYPTAAEYRMALENYLLTHEKSLTPKKSVGFWHFLGVK